MADGHAAVGGPVGLQALEGPLVPPGIHGATGAQAREDHGHAADLRTLFYHRPRHWDLN